MQHILLIPYAVLATADPSNLFGNVVGWICKISYALALITFISGVYRYKHDPSEAVVMMISAALFAAAVGIVGVFFNAAGMSSSIIIGQ